MRVRRRRELAGDARRLAVGWAGPDLAFYEDFTAEENLRFLPARRRAGARRAATIARRLEEVGLRTRRARRVGAFSTGMKQRLRLAFATLFDPPILLLDEPMPAWTRKGALRRRGGRGPQPPEGAVILASNDARDFARPTR